MRPASRLEEESRCFFLSGHMPTGPPSWEPPQEALVVHVCTLTVALMFACRYPSDDINKFLWMVRIGGGVFP